MSTLTDARAGATASGEIASTYRESINAALDEELAADPNVVFIGEDVGNAGGVFKTNDGLAEKYGPRVITTPICENGFTGVALGMSLMGLRPVVEIMFADFLPMASDAITNQLAKYRFMSGGQFAVPVTLRVISGGGGRFGTQHSATGESWFMGLPGLRICAASSAASAYSLLRAAIRDDNPVLFHEHKALYVRQGTRRTGEIAEIGRAEVMRPGADVTILATMLMVERSLKAAETLAGEGIDAEVIDLRWIRPLDLATVGASVGKTGRLVVAEEQVHAGGWGATVISELAMAGIGFRARPRAVSLPADIPIPYSPPLEDLVIPSAEAIAAAAREAVAGG